MTITWLIILLITLLFSAFFSGMEIAFVSANKLELDMAIKDEEWENAQFFKRMNDNDSLFFSATLLGNNISLVLFGIVFSKLFDPLWSPFLPTHATEIWLLLVNTLVSTLVILFAGEYIPKSLFRINPARILRIYGTFFKYIYFLLTPLIKITVFISEAFFKFVTGKNPEPNNSLLSHFDLKTYIDERLMQATVIDTDGKKEVNLDAKMLGKVVEFESAKARECLVPRNLIDGIEKSASLEEVKAKMVETGHSRLIVYKGNIDTPVGYYFHQDIIKGKDTIRTIAFFPETKSAWEILTYFTNNKKSIAIIVDEYGGTAGMVTLEDLIEEIFGEINDEYDKEKDDELIEVIEENKEYRFSALVEIDFLREDFDLRLPQSEEYETLGGLIAHTLEYIPKKYEKIDIGQYTLTVEKASPSRIEVVRLVVND